MKNLLVAVDFSNSTEPTIAQASILSKALGVQKQDTETGDRPEWR